MAKERFSKQKVRKTILERVVAIQSRERAFNHSNGWDQVKNAGTERKVAYGKWRALLDLLEALEL